MRSPPFQAGSAIGARGASARHGLERAFEFPASGVGLRISGAESCERSGHTFVVIEVEPFSDEEQKLEEPPFDGPELKLRLGRHIESITGCSIFGYRFERAASCPAKRMRTRRFGAVGAVAALVPDGTS